MRNQIYSKKRRKLLMTASLSSAVISTISITKWVKPVVSSVVLPAHGQTSADSGRNVILRFTDRVDSINPDPARLPAGVAFRDPLQIDVTVNNGNNSIANQTWRFTDLVNIEVRAGSNYSAQINPLTGTIFDNSGVFQTGGSGNLLALLILWGVFLTDGMDIDSNGEVIIEWYLGNCNNIIYLNDVMKGLGSALDGINSLVHWSIV